MCQRTRALNAENPMTKAGMIALEAAISRPLILYGHPLACSVLSGNQRRPAPLECWSMLGTRPPSGGLSTDVFCKGKVDQFLHEIFTN